LRLWAAFRKEQDQQYTRDSGQHSGEEQDQQYTRGSGQHSEKNKINNILEALGSFQEKNTYIVELVLLLKAAQSL
jgi:hypothetical protein